MDVAPVVVLAHVSCVVFDDCVDLLEENGVAVFEISVNVLLVCFWFPPLVCVADVEILWSSVYLLVKLGVG